VVRAWIAALSAGLFATALYSQQQKQQLDPIAKWATIAQYEDSVSLNIVYQKANNVELRLDAFTIGPRSVRRPTLIYFHGGGWLEGSKDGTLFYVLPYLARGMNAVNVEYRMAPESLAPAAVEDCRCALHWVYDHAAEYGFDTSKIVVSGHSAGGHLALMTGMLRPSDGLDYSCRRPSDDWRLGTTEDVKVAAVVSFFGPTDLTKLIQGPDTRNYALRWFGSLPDREELAERVSPITYVRSGDPPILQVTGDKDPIVPPSQYITLHEALDRAEVPNQLYIVRGGGHGSTTPYAWTREQNLAAQQAVFSFLERYGILPSTP
jgi:acetyl esterase/lipase